MNLDYEVVSLITPEWSKIWTVEEAEKKIVPFKFMGVGWYCHKNRHNNGTCVTLVLPHGAVNSHHHELYKFMVWNNSTYETIVKAFATIASASLVVDERVK